MSSTNAPRERSFTGLASPCSIGPLAGGKGSTGPVLDELVRYLTGDGAEWPLSGLGFRVPGDCALSRWEGGKRKPSLG